MFPTAIYTIIISIAIYHEQYRNYIHLKLKKKCIYTEFQNVYYE